MAFMTMMNLYMDVMNRAMTEALVMYARAFDTGAFLPLDPLVDWVRS